MIRNDSLTNLVEYGTEEAPQQTQEAPDGAGLASASSDRTVRLWETKARGESTELKGHGGPVRCVDYAPDARRLLTASDDKTVKIWALPQRKFLCTLGAGELGSPGAAKSPRLRGGAGSATTSHSNWVRAARWAPDGRLCASASDDKLVKLWDVEGRSCVRTFFEHEGAVRDVAFSGDGTCVVSGGDDGKVNVWDARSHGLIQHYASHAGPITSIAMEPRAGHYLASSGDDGTLKLYDLRQGQVLYTLRGHEGAATAAAFSPRSTDGELFASGGADKVVMVWRTKLDGCAPQPPSTTRPRAARAKGGALKATTRGNKTPAPHHPALADQRASRDGPQQAHGDFQIERCFLLIGRPDMCPAHHLVEETCDQSALHAAARGDEGIGGVEAQSDFLALPVEAVELHAHQIGMRRAERVGGAITHIIGSSKAG